MVYIITWRGLAVIAGKYLSKGSLVYVEGKIRYRHYKDKKGQKKYVTEIMADQIVMPDKKPVGTIELPEQGEGAAEAFPF